MSEHRIAACRSCGADIIWFENPKTGRRMPVDAETVEVGDTELDLRHMISHFATCPQANTWRKPKENNK